MGSNASLTVAEREHHANALYAASRYNEAYDDYRALAADPGVQDAEQRDGLLVAAAACDYKLKRAYRQQIAALPAIDEDVVVRDSVRDAPRGEPVLDLGQLFGAQRRREQGDARIARRDESERAHGLICFRFS